MAATELIHFPSWALLGPRHLLPTFETASLVRFNLSRLYACAPDSAECSRRLLVTGRDGL